MKTSQLQLGHNNYNKKSLIFALLIYLPLIATAAELAAYKPQTQALNVGDQAVALNFANIQEISGKQSSEEQNSQKQISPQKKEEKVQEAKPLPEKKIEKKVQAKPERKKRPRKSEKKQQKQQKEYSTKKTVNSNAASRADNKGQSAYTKAEATSKNTRSMVFGKDSNPMLIAIKKAIDSNLIYPRKAQKMRYKGRVLIKFSFNDNGLIFRKVLESSGYDILDKAAIRTIEKASADFPKANGDITVTIPIEFKIK